MMTFIMVAQHLAFGMGAVLLFLAIALPTNVISKNAKRQKLLIIAGGFFLVGYIAAELRLAYFQGVITAVVENLT